MYVPPLGRFASRDPVGYRYCINLLEYVGDGPTKWVDPLGLQAGGGSARPFPPGGDTISIAFPKDADTRLATLFNWIQSGFDGISIHPGRPDWQKAIDELDAYPDHSIDLVIISGHGGPTDAGAIRYGDIINPGSPTSKFLCVLKEKLMPGSEIRLRCCRCASGTDGKKFIQCIADQTGGTVIGIDGDYAVTPGGCEWIATPGGGTPKPGRDFGDPLNSPKDKVDPEPSPPPSSPFCGPRF